MPMLKRVYRFLRYGIMPGAREKKWAKKTAVRKVAFDSERWRHNEDLAKRSYSSYDEYREHQSAKFGKVVHRLYETEAEDFENFKHRFKDCTPLKEARSVLCLGARLGTEVKALHSLGYFAVGIDLNPGPGNMYVLPGDFHRVVFPDGSVDVIYTNALDHVFDLDKVVLEIARLLRPNGLFVVDMLPGFEEGFIPGAYEATHWRTSKVLIDKLCELSAFTIEEQRDLGQIRRDRWMQVVFRKPAPGS